MAIDRIADELAIRTVQQNYFHGVDAKDWDLFASVVSQDAVFDFRAAVDPDLPPIRGRAAIVDFVRKSMSGITSAHHGFLRKLEFIGDDAARALWAMEDILWRGEPEALKKYINGHGSYNIEYVRSDPSWQINFWKLGRTFVETFQD